MVLSKIILDLLQDGCIPIYLFIYLYRLRWLSLPVRCIVEVYDIVIMLGCAAIWDIRILHRDFQKIRGPLQESF